MAWIDQKKKNTGRHPKNQCYGLKGSNRLKARGLRYQNGKIIIRVICEEKIQSVPVCRIVPRLGTGNISTGLFSASFLTLFFSTDHYKTLIVRLRGASCKTMHSTDQTFPELLC